MFCTRCGMKCREDARFCPRCGQQLSSIKVQHGPAGTNDESEMLDEDATLLIGSGQQRYRKLTGEPEEAAGYRGRESVYPGRGEGRRISSPEPRYYDGRGQMTAESVARKTKSRHTVRNVFIILAVVLAAAGASGGYFVYMAVQPGRTLDRFMAAVEEEKWPEVMDCIEWGGETGMSREEFEAYLNARAEEIRQWSSSTKVRYEKDDRVDEKTSVTVLISKKGMQLAAPERELEMVRPEEAQLFFLKGWKLTPQSAVLLLEC